MVTILMMKIIEYDQKEKPTWKAGSEKGESHIENMAFLGKDQKAWLTRVKMKKLPKLVDCDLWATQLISRN